MQPSGNEDRVVVVVVVAFRLGLRQGLEQLATSVLVESAWAGGCECLPLLPPFLLLFIPPICCSMEYWDYSVEIDCLTGPQGSIDLFFISLNSYLKC